MCKAVLGLLFLVACGHAFIVPQEVPSILSLVYSNVPPIKKGTDSRVGFGFRLGEHADFQVVYELGPQKYTRKLGTSDSDSNNSKRNADYESYKESSNPAGAKWLSNWSNGMRSKPKGRPQNDLQSNNVEAVKTMPFIADSALKQLQLLYGRQKTVEPESIGVIPAEQLDQDFKIIMEEPRVDKAKITADLMDVDLD